MLISHHPPSQYCRTYKVLNIRVCARCLGIPIGLVISSFLTLEMPWWCLLLLPIPTFLQFMLQELEILKGYNLLKTILTIPLGLYVFEWLLQVVEFHFLALFLLTFYILLIESIIALILSKKNKIEALVEAYENGIYR